MNVTIFLMVSTGFFYLLSLFFGGSLISASPLFLMNAPYNFPRLWFHTIITSMFTPASIFSLLFTELMLYSLGKNVEFQFGPKFMAALYGISTLFGLIMLILVQYMQFLLMPGIPIFSQSVQWCGILGIITFLLYLVGLNREMRFYLYFIPIKLKAKYILLIIIIQASVTAILSLIFPLDFSLALSLAELAGLLAGKLFFDKFGGRFSSGFY